MSAGRWRKPTGEEARIMIKKETYTVEGMSCNHCKMAVEKEV